MASLLGRILRTYCALIVVISILVTGPLQAAPFAAIVMDGRTGEILYEKNARTRLHPASLTKMMTLYIVFQEVEAGRISLDTKVTVSDYAAAQPPSRLGLKPGQKISIRHLVRAAAIKSANDAAAALGDAISGNRVAFAKRMTRTAREMGMRDTTFKNAHGLTAEGHLSTAYDMNILGRHLFYDFPEYYSLFSRRTADAGVATVRNTNARFLDAYKGADGIKTGFTNPAGFNLTASAHRGGVHIIATVFGGTSSANRNAKMAELMDLGFAKAPKNAREKPPIAAPIVDNALIASAEDEIDKITAGSGSTAKASGAVSVSLRPRPRPGVPTMPNTVAVAMVEDINAALALAAAEPAPEPAPEGTLEFQAEAIAATDAVDAPVADAAGVALAAADVTALEPPVAPEPGSLEAQAAALASAADNPVASAEIDPVLVRAKPKSRPETLTAQVAAAKATAQPAQPEGEVLLAAAEPELVVTDPGPEVTRAEGSVPLIAEIAETAPLVAETPAPPALAEEPAVVQAAAAPQPARQAPIFETVEVAATPAEPAVEEVVVVMSTSGGRHFGVNVGEYPSRYEAERALLKTALAESATLHDGLRKTSQSGGVWRASFMGLTEDQANLACRRLAARAIPCETVGG